MHFTLTRTLPALVVTAGRCLFHRSAGLQGDGPVPRSIFQPPGLMAHSDIVVASVEEDRAEPGPGDEVEELLGSNENPSGPASRSNDR